MQVATFPVRDCFYCRFGPEARTKQGVMEPVQPLSFVPQAIVFIFVSAKMHAHGR